MLDLNCPFCKEQFYILWMLASASSSGNFCYVVPIEVKDER